MFEHVISMVVVGAALVALMMFILWLLHLRLRNASVVDPGWAFGLVILAVVYAVMGPGAGLRRWLFAGMVFVWGVRLGVYLLLRISGQPEEGRYQQLRKEWRQNVALKFLLFFELQALLDVFLSTPFLLASLNHDPALHFPEYAGTAIWAIAISGEAMADGQLASFKRDASESGGGVCQRGLWNYSRHPNYFFEWLIWVAWAVFALGSPYGWLAIACPMLMLYFLFRVTGIPATEAQALRSKGEAYRAYQQSTSAFIPWFKRAH